VVELSLDEFRAALLAESSMLTVAEFDQAIQCLAQQATAETIELTGVV